MSERQSRPLPVSGSPRSPVWRWYLGTSTATAYTLITGLLMGMVQSAFSDSALGKSAVTTLSGLFWALLVVAALYVGFRLVSGTRERSRRARELAVTADLIAPGVEVKIGDDWELEYLPPGRATGKPSDECELLVRALDTLLIGGLSTGLSVDAIVALHAALVDAKDRIPGKSSLRKDAVIVINELVKLSYLKFVAPGRFRYTAVPRGDHGPEEYLLATVLPAFLQHYADLATGWATALNTTDLAKGAARWFEDEHELLHNLVLQAPGRCEPDKEQSARRWRRRSVLVELSRIADALDVWYTINGQPGEMKDLAARLRKPIKERPSRFPLLYALADIRAAQGDVNEPEHGFRPHSAEATVAARREHQNALHKLTAEMEKVVKDAEPDLDDVEKQVERVWWKLARRDVAGEVCALVNLAVVHLYQGRLEAAQDRLELAEYLTRTGRDPGGRAHALELRGTVCWVRGTRRRAIRYWQRSLDLYQRLGEVHGEARCQQHLGSALVVMPTLGGLVLDATEGQLNERMVLRAAVKLLQSSKRKRPSKTAVRYLCIARNRLACLPDNASDHKLVAVASPGPPEPRPPFWRTFLSGR
ncbi:MAG: hypothetical protein J2P19_13500 [Pseudonocardia sp.]|nr:hypothetical protein [Pseudonocardia sp.]